VIEEQGRWRHAVTLGLLGLVVIAAGYLAVSEIGTPSSSARTGTQFVTAADGIVQSTVSGAGDVAAGTDDDVNFATSGTLERVSVHQGEHVTKGQSLATLDPTSAQLTLDEARTTLTAAQDNLSDAEKSTTEQTTLDQDELAVENDEQAVKSDELALSETTLRAPATGTIASLEELSPGQSVAAGSSWGAASSSDSSSSSSSSSGSSSSSSSFAEIINTNTLTMTVAISEADIGEIKVGQPATVTMDALSGVELAAHVAAISSTATDSDDVVSYEVTLDLDQTDSSVLSGMSASAVVVVDQAAGVTVPNDAISGSGSQGTVTLDQDGKRVERQVVVGLRGATRSVIVSGVKAGDELVVSESLPSRGSGTTTTGTGSSGILGGSSGLAGALGGSP
jgi:membrane fusion protein, macrolide-specific efflux system